MKLIKNKKTLSAIAIVTLIAIVGTTVMLHSNSALAQRRFSGLDALIQEKTEATETFNILEIVEDQGEIGFYFDGNEPFSVDEDGYAVDFVTTISKIVDKKDRETYVEEQLDRLSGKYWTQEMSGSASDYPMSYNTYRDAYFVDDESAWNWNNFSQREYVKIAGEYVPVESGAYGDYAKNSDYMLAYDYEKGTYNGNYVENLAGFDVSAADLTYHVNFGTDLKAEYQELGAYTRGFESAGAVSSQEAFETLKEQNNGKYWIKDGDSYTEIDLNDYVYPDTAESEANVIAQDTVLYQEYYQYAGMAGTEAQSGYYYVQNYSYAFDGLNYTGEYGAILKNGEEPYVKCEAGKGTHKLSEYEYSYTPGMGNYNFVEDSEKEEVFVEVSGFYYQGGFINNNWFRQKVFLSSQDNVSLNLLPVSVRTFTAEQLAKACKGDVSIFNDIDLLVISGNEKMFKNCSASVMNNIASKLESEIEVNKLPCIVEKKLVEGTSDSKLVKTLQKYYDSSKNGSIGSTDGSIYWYKGDLFNINLDEVLKEPEKGFSEVLDYIKEENKYLSLRNEEIIPEEVSQATIIQYILSCKYARNNAPKEQVTVLEIEPCADYILTAEKVKAITGYEELKTENIEIVQMTTAEFVGKIHDLNGVYDFIYIGMQTGLMNVSASTGETVYNDSSMNGLVYTHTGDAVIAAERLTGLLDTDYVDNNRENLPYSRDVYKIRTTIDEETGKLVLNPDLIKFKINTPNKSEVEKTVTLGNQGVYRYSGNDITKENVEHLMDYVNAGYPVILDKQFAVDGTTYDKMQISDINTSKVDNSSWLYDFLVQSFEKENVFLNTGALSTDENFNFYMNLPKLQLTFYKEANEGSSSSYYIEDTSVTAHMTDDTEKFVKKIDGQYYLTYVLSIEDLASTSSLDTNYTVSLFVDINSDGKYSREHEMMQDIRVMDAESGEDVAYDSLLAGKKYIVTRRIPDAFRSIVSWKLEVSLSEKSGETEDASMLGSNDQSLIRKSQIGYSKLKTDEKTTIKIYQILSDKKGNGRDNNTWNLAEDYAARGDFFSDINSLEEYTLAFTSVYVTDYQNPSANNGKEYSTAEEYYKLIEDYDMLIIGFSDVYEGFTNPYAVDAILQFIETGKSVLFTHDTTSFVNYPGDTADNIAGENGGIFSFWDNSSNAIGGDRWGYLFNQIVRDKLGMDRYGITNPDVYLGKTSGMETEDGILSVEEAKRLLESLLKKGEILDTSEKVCAYLPGTTYEGTVNELIQLSEKEAAYVAGSGKSQTYPETQGYTYMMLNSCINLLGENNKTVDQDGKKIVTRTTTKYLNLNSDSGVANLGKTWTESFREFFEDLFGSDDWLGQLIGSFADWLGGIFDKYLGTMRNGSFDKMEISCVNQGQITEYPFKIGDTVQVASTHAQYYQLDMEADQDNDGESDIVVWYCISDGYSGTSKGKANPYTASPNDVRNNYYIYSIGNVFYTGAGHKAINRTEKQLFINTMVAAYNASVNEPSVAILESENISATEMSSMNLPVEYSMSTQSDYTSYIGDTVIKIPYSVYDDNFVYASDTVKELSVEYFIEDANGTEVINGVKVKKLENVITTQGGSQVGSIQSGNAYTAIWSPTSDELYQYISNNESFGIYVRVKSEFMYNGEKSVLYGYDKLALKKTNLFELD